MGITSLFCTHDCTLSATLEETNKTDVMNAVIPVDMRGSTRLHSLLLPLRYEGISGGGDCSL